MKTFVRAGLTLLALAACGQEGGFANEFEPKIQQEQRLDEVDHYLAKELGDGLDQVTSVNTFSDVQPTDWAYQALKNLVDTYGCVAGFPDSSFRGSKAISRYEAAALLDACLENISTITDEVRRLMREFERELAILKGKVDGLEAKVGELEAMSFSTTTKLNVALFNWYAANSYAGSSKAKGFNRDFGGFSNAYGIIPTLTTSFTGKDNLKIIGLTGNCFDASPAAAAPYLATYAPQCSAGVLNDNSAESNELVLWRTYYSTPLFSDDLTLTISPQMYAYDFLPISNAVFGPKGGSLIGLQTLPLDLLQNAGVPGVYPYVLGAGAGLSYQKDGWSAAIGYVSDGGNSSMAEMGMFGENSVKETIVQVALTKPEAGFQLAWSHTQYPKGGFVFQEGTPLTANPFSFSVPFTVNSFSGGGYFYLAPEISISGGINKLYYTASDGNTDIEVSSGDRGSAITGVVTLQWEKAFFEQLTLGASYGVPTYMVDNPSNGGTDDQPNMILGFANWTVSDNIRVSPSIYWVDGAGGRNDEDTSTLGFIMMTSFFF